VNDAPGGPAEYATTALALSASIKKSGANKHGTSSFVNNAKRSEMASKLLYDVGESGGASWGLSGADGVSSHDRPDSHKDDTDLNRVGTRKPLSRKGLSSFASTSLRSELASKALPADVAPGSYEVTPTWSAASPQKSLPVHKYKVNPKSMTALIPASKPNKDYLTSQKRFYRRIPEETPGPGAYDPNASSAAAKSVPIEVRFQRGLGDYLNSKSVAMAAAKVGPGSYSIGGSMVKKSFNVNFAQE
jgi:Sperm-tail PG-rich repeat